jgi:hypothetical protein
MDGSCDYDTLIGELACYKRDFTPTRRRELFKGMAGLLKAWHVMTFAAPVATCEKCEMRNFH